MRVLVNRLFLSRKGAAAVEFAIVAPIFLAAMLTMIGYGIYLSAATSIQQITADAARAAIAGLSPAERETLAADFVASAARDRPFIDPARLNVAISENETVSGQLSVRIDYDATELPVWSLFSYAMPDSRIITRRSIVRIGGI